jgi:hypothetical protein
VIGRRALPAAPDRGTAGEGFEVAPADGGTLGGPSGFDGAHEANVTTTARATIAAKTRTAVGSR